MPRFFIPAEAAASGGQIWLRGPQADHVRRSLRMQPGQPLTVCDGQGSDYPCVIDGFEEGAVRLRVLRREPSAGEPSIEVTLYQGLPKGDKMDVIVQKAVELGVSAIVPVAMARSVVRLEDKADKKQARWQRIADEAAGQSERGRLPVVLPPQTFCEVIPHLAGEATVVCYEGGGRPLAEGVDRAMRRLSIVIGPEGGIAPEEMEALRTSGAFIATLGPRILRCETAPLATLAVIMALSGNME